MAHYALLDENNIVINVVSVGDETEGLEAEKRIEEITGLKCKRTSYNTFNGIHCNGGEPFRMNYATIGGTYDEERDIFLPPKPFPSWIINEDTLTWEAPIPQPTDKDYLKKVTNEIGETLTFTTLRWNEDDLNWEEFDI